MIVEQMLNNAQTPLLHIARVIRWYGKFNRNLN